MGRLTYTMENNTDSITLENRVGRNFFKAAGATGMGFAPTKVVIREGAGDGGTMRGWKRGPRYIDMPMIIFGANADEIEAKMHRIARIWNNKFDPPRLIATYPDGTQWYIPFTFAGGADPVYGTADTDSRTHANWMVSLACADPYWIAMDETAIEPIRTSVSGRGMIRTGSGGLSRLQLSSSQTIGTVTITNPGDVEAWPIWIVTGPGDSFLIQRLADGATIDYQEDIDGKVITIDTRPRIKTIIDELGANKYGAASSAGAPKLFSIPPGEAQISVEVPNATGDTSVQMRFYARRELVFG